MKRPHDEDASEEEPRTSMPRKEESSLPEQDILHDLHTNLMRGDLNKQIEKRLFETQKQYFTVYMEKLMHKIPMGMDLVRIIRGTGASNEFEYMFTAAKSVIQSQMQVKQIKAFHAVFDMVYSLMWRYVHEKVVSPTLNRILSEQQLNGAYEKYQSCCNVEEEGSVVEMQCLLYCIQEMLENQETVKIPNPLYSRLTQQMKAMSEYVIAILVSLSKPVLSEANKAGEEAAAAAEPTLETNRGRSDATTEEIVRLGYMRDLEGEKNGERLAPTDAEEEKEVMFRERMDDDDDEAEEMESDTE